MSRRDMLRLLGIAGAGVVLGACGQATTGGSETPGVSNAGGVSGGQGSSPTSTQAAPASQATKGMNAGTAAPSRKVDFNIPDSGAKMPTKEVSLHWIDSGDQKAEFFKQFFAAYQQKHPNIKVDYKPLPWTQITEVVPLGVRNGTAPDVFQKPSNITTGQMVDQGWLHPLDDVVPNFEQWKKAFPPLMFLPGITDFNGKTYAAPLTNTSNRQNKLTLYNKDYLEKAGYDPASETLTWGSFREACKKVTKQGKGQYYGFIMGGKQGGAYSGFVSTLAQMAGAIGGEWNWKTGEYNFDTEQYISAIELMLALKSDGSIFPGVISMNNPQARARIANGVAGIILQGPWNIPQWERENPDFNFGVASVPLRDPDKFVPLAQAPGNGGKWYVYGKSDNTAVIGDVFSYLGSLQGQIAWAKIDTVADPAAFPKALDKVIESGAVDKKKQFALKMDQQQTRIAPSPVIRNSDIGEVNLAYKTPDPEFWQVVQGLFTGQLSDIKKQMKDTKDRYTKAREDAIKTAKSRGAKVSMDDYVFPNWDPQKDYVPEDYKALK